MTQEHIRQHYNHIEALSLALEQFAGEICVNSGVESDCRALSQLKPPATLERIYFTTTKEHIAEAVNSHSTEYTKGDRAFLVFLVDGKAPNGSDLYRQKSLRKYLSRFKKCGVGDLELYEFNLNGQKAVTVDITPALLNAELFIQRIHQNKHHTGQLINRRQWMHKCSQWVTGATAMSTAYHGGRSIASLYNLEQNPSPENQQQHEQNATYTILSMGSTFAGAAAIAFTRMPYSAETRNDDGIEDIPAAYIDGLSKEVYEQLKQSFAELCMDHAQQKSR